MKFSSKPIKKYFEHKGPLKIVLFLVLIILTCVLVFFLLKIDDGFETNSDTSSIENKPSEKPAADTKNNSEDSGSSSSNKPFSVTKVYFAKAPQAPSGAGYGDCQISQKVEYKATAQITATSKGSASYHWEVSDHLSGNVEKLETQTLNFDGAGTKEAETILSYIVRDNGNGNNLWNRQYINLIVTSPNTTYANIDSPVYAYSSDPDFVWGTYIDLC